MKFSEFYTLTDNLPFTVAITVVTLLSLVEGVAFILGFGIINFLDSLLPNVEFDIDGPTLEDSGLISSTLSFLRVKNVPIIILLIAFLMSFGVSGLILQGFCISLLGSSMSGFILGIPSFFIALVLMKAFGEVIAKIMPKDETDAVTLESFVGKVGTITLGTAEKAKPAQVKLRDKKGTIHYVMAFPDRDNEKIGMGEKVLLVRYEEPYFYIIKPNNKNL